MGKKAGCKRIDFQLPLELVPMLDALVAAHHSTRSEVITDLISDAASPQEASTSSSKGQFNPANYSRAVAMAQKASQGRLDPITAATVVSAAITAFHDQPARTDR